MPPENQGLEKNQRKVDKYAALGIGLSDTENSIIDLGETLWNLIGSPILEKDYQRVGFPIGDDMSIQAERGTGLYGQFERPDLMREPQKDLRITLSKFF